MVDIEERISVLTDELRKALNSKIMTFDQTKDAISCGIYLVYLDDKIIYVGKTSRTGKIRLRELASDYRSHTLNRKLLRLFINKELNVNLSPLTNSSKQKMIKDGIVSNKDFLIFQNTVNYFIKNELRFKYWITDPDKVSALEHFAISIFNPEFND
jgi:hypothetical protein